MRRDHRSRSRLYRVGMVLVGGLFLLGFLNACDDRLLGLARVFEPCGTVFANCTPGSFLVNQAEVGDYCVDPGCTVPGQCTEQPQPPLGALTDLCP